VVAVSFSLIRLVTSWATKESAVEEFIAELSRLM
jgi:threonine aldolase